MTAQLVPINAGSAPPIAISRPVLLIGRHVECDIRIDSPQVSRRHCCVAVAYDRVVIRDLGSLHGVRVNGQIIEEARLNPGDEVAISFFLYRFETLEPTPQVARANRPVSVLAPQPIRDSDSDFIPID